MSDYFKDRGFISSLIPAIQEGVNNYNVVKAGGAAASEILNAISSTRATNASQTLSDYISNVNSKVTVEDARNSLKTYSSLHDPSNESHVNFLNTARNALTDEAVQERDESLTRYREDQKAKMLEENLTGITQSPMTVSDQIEKIDESLSLANDDITPQRERMIEDFGGVDALNSFESKYDDLLASRELGYLNTKLQSKKTLENTKEIAGIIRSLLVKRKKRRISPAMAVEIDDAVYTYKVEHGGKS